MSVPSGSLFKTVTVRCGHCTNLLPVNMRGLLLPSANQFHLGHSFFTPHNLLVCFITYIYIYMNLVRNVVLFPNVVVLLIILINSSIYKRDLVDQLFILLLDVLMMIDVLYYTYIYIYIYVYTFFFFFQEEIPNPAPNFLMNQTSCMTDFAHHVPPRGVAHHDELISRPPVINRREIIPPARFHTISFYFLIIHEYFSFS